MHRFLYRGENLKKKLVTTNPRSQGLSSARPLKQETLGTRMVTTAISLNGSFGIKPWMYLFEITRKVF